MDNQFKILILYKTKWIVASVQEIDLPGQYQYNLELPDHKTTVYNYDSNNAELPKMNDHQLNNSVTEAYVEEDALEPALATIAGKAIEAYKQNGYQPFTVTVAGQEFTVMGYLNEKSTSEFYSVYQDGECVFNLQIDDEGLWELKGKPSVRFDADLIHKIGYEIESLQVN